MSERRFHARSILRGRPKGGYRRVSNAQICMIWRAYKSRLLPKFYDVRVYLALHEVAESLAMKHRMEAPRNTCKRETRLTYDRLKREVHAVMRSLNHQLIRASIGRLEEAGLVALNGPEISFASHPTELCDGNPQGFDEMWTAIDSRERVRARTIPIPRRILRYLARDGTPGITATLLGHSIRCLWFAGNQCSFAGH